MKCRHCDSTDIVCNGLSVKGKQRRLCRSCGKTLVDDPIYRGLTPDQQALAISLHQEGLGFRAIARTVDRALNTVLRFLKKWEIEASSA